VGQDRSRNVVQKPPKCPDMRRSSTSVGAHGRPGRVGASLISWVARVPRRPPLSTSRPSSISAESVMKADPRESVKNCGCAAVSGRRPVANSGRLLLRYAPQVRPSARVTRATKEVKMPRRLTRHDMRQNFGQWRTIMAGKRVSTGQRAASAAGKSLSSPTASKAAQVCGCIGAHPVQGRRSEQRSGRIVYGSHPLPSQGQCGAKSESASALT
jgi:hypothetical protein